MISGKAGENLPTTHPTVPPIARLNHSNILSIFLFNWFLTYRRNAVGGLLNEKSNRPWVIALFVMSDV
jgi:hypothetical protein